jgi:hypothetical protein
VRFNDNVPPSLRLTPVEATYHNPNHFDVFLISFYDWSVYIIKYQIEGDSRIHSFPVFRNESPTEVAFTVDSTIPYKNDIFTI